MSFSPTVPIIIVNLQIFSGFVSFILLPFQIPITQSCSKHFWLLPFISWWNFVMLTFLWESHLESSLFATRTCESSSDLILCWQVLREWQFAVCCQALWCSAHYIESSFSALDETPSICSAPVRGFVYRFSPLAALCCHIFNPASLVTLAYVPDKRNFSNISAC